MAANVPVGALAAISYGPPNRTSGRFRGFDLPAAIFKGHLSYRKVCPPCLAEAAYHRAIWDLAFVSACPRHEVALLAACPDCDRILTWIGADLTKCGCHRGDLIKAATAPLPSGILEGTRATYGLFGDHSFVANAAQIREMPPFRRMRPEHVVEFLYRLGLGLVTHRRKLFSLERPGTPRISGISHCRLAWML